MTPRLRLLTPALITTTTLALHVGNAWASTGDHQQYELLQQNFATGPDVTKACLQCHTDAANQIMDTIHWSWVCPKAREGGVGKAGDIINNFCIGLPSNEPRCTSCHAGYGWKDKSFDFSDQTKVDCLVCHDTTGTYKKFPTAAGHPPYEPKEFKGKVWNPPDLTKIAQNVGKPNRDTCGSCHFYGGGGEGVKHADLDASLFHPDRSLDVHMDEEGLNFDCQACHSTHDHQIAGRCYAVPAAESTEFSFPVRSDPSHSHIYCESCHGNEPHEDSKLNDHMDKVSCQACHVPRASRRKATKGWWDWSKAGRLDENGKPVVEKDDKGRMTYHAKKGEFRWSKNFIPDYYWFNGSMENILLPDKIDAANPPVSINKPRGHYNDPNARIWPMKVHRGKQPYDKGNSTFVVPKLFGKKGTGAYWAEFDWDKSITTGMQYVGQPYSGEYGFVETEMYWPITHMIAPKEDAVACAECHTREGGRLASLQGFYMPGRDRSSLLDGAGWTFAILSLAGVFAHGGIRFAASRKRNGPSPAPSPPQNKDAPPTRKEDQKDDSKEEQA